MYSVCYVYIGHVKFLDASSLNSIASSGLFFSTLVICCTKYNRGTILNQIFEAWACWNEMRAAERYILCLPLVWRLIGGISFVSLWILSEVGTKLFIKYITFVFLFSNWPIAFAWGEHWVKLGLWTREILNFACRGEEKVEVGDPICVEKGHCTPAQR